MVDITLNKDGVKHEVILTCYNTANRLYVQKRGVHSRFESLGGSFVPKYFMEHYLVPFAQKVLEDNPDIDEKFCLFLKLNLLD